MSLVRPAFWSISLALILLASAGASAHPEGAHEDKSFGITFTCEGFGASIPVDAATARDEGDVPAHFHLANESTGFTDVSVGAYYCSRSEVDGEATAPFNYSLVSINLDAPDSPEYDVWQFMDLKEWHHRIESFGGWSRLLNRFSVDVSRVRGTPVSGHADVPWPQSPYTVDAVIPGTAPVPEVKFSSDHWFSGSHGDVHAHHDNMGLSVVGAIDQRGHHAGNRPRATPRR